MSKITVAVLSPVCKIGDVEANLAHFEEWVAECVAQGAELVAFPELALCGYAYDPALKMVAQAVPGPTTCSLEQIARRYRVYISVGILEKQNGNYYNAQIVVGPQGYLGHYRKHYPTPKEREVLSTLPGKAYPTFEIVGIRFGINICADSRQMDTIEALAARGVRLVHNPHANFLSLGQNAEEWTRGKLVYYLPRVIACRAHILINNVAGSVCDTAGTSYAFSSGAMILDPLGQVVVRTTQTDCGEKMVISTVDTDLASYVPRFELDRLQKSGKPA
jgi:predicted amidohydrolase